jgi:hypothetical protein
MSNRHFGQTGTNTLSYSAAGIRDAMDANPSIDYEQAVAVTIAHELSLHIIGGINGHYEIPGFVDSATSDPKIMQRGARALLSSPASLRMARGLSLVAGE